MVLIFNSAYSIEIRSQLYIVQVKIGQIETIQLFHLFRYMNFFPSLFNLIIYKCTYSPVKYN